MNAADFELRWSSCANRSHALVGRLPSSTPNPTLSDTLETALMQRGFFCVAAGAVGDLHKLYFCGELTDDRSATWLMVEIVLHWRAASVQATFRCDAYPRLLPLADECAELLAPILHTHFAPSYA